MTTLRVQNLRGQIVWSTANSALSLALEEDLSSQTEVANFESHLLGQEQISEFEVSVDDLTRMDVLEGLCKLVDVVASLDLVESLTTLDQVRQRLILANVEHDVDIFSVFKVPVESDNKLVIE